MSDSGEVSPSRSRSRERGRSRRRHSRSESSSGSRSRSGSGSAFGESDDAEEVNALVQAGVIKLCSEHNTELVPDACVACRGVSRIVKPNMLAQLVKIGNSKSAQQTPLVPSAADRFALRLDMKPPSLKFKEADMDLATNIFTRGKMVPASMFEDLTKEFLFLGQDQNEALTKNLQIERLLQKYKRDKQYSHIFKYVEDLSKITKHYRVSERPVFMAMAELTRVLDAVRQHGMDLGFLYPEIPPNCQLLGPRIFPNLLSYTQMPIMPLPPLADVLEGVTDISEADRSSVTAKVLLNEIKLKEQRRELSVKIGGFMDTVSSAVNRLDSFLGFHLDMHAHVDGEMRDMMRDKASNLFLPSYRGAVKGSYLSRGEREKLDPAGLLGGEDQIRSRLSEATKEDELLKKTLAKGYQAKKFAKKKGQGTLLFWFSFL